MTRKEQIINLGGYFKNNLAVIEREDNKDCKMYISLTELEKASAEEWERWYFGAERWRYPDIANYQNF